MNHLEFLHWRVNCMAENAVHFCATQSRNDVISLVIVVVVVEVKKVVVIFTFFFVKFLLEWQEIETSCPSLLHLQPQSEFFRGKLGQSRDFWRTYGLFQARVASFAPERSDGANGATRDTNYMPDKSHLIIIIINTQGQIVV